MPGNVRNCWTKSVQILYENINVAFHAIQILVQYTHVTVYIVLFCSTVYYVIIRHYNVDVGNHSIEKSFTMHSGKCRWISVQPGVVKLIVSWYVECWCCAGTSHCSRHTCCLWVYVRQFPRTTLPWWVSSLHVSCLLLYFVLLLMYLFHGCILLPVSSIVSAVV